MNNVIAPLVSFIEEVYGLSELKTEELNEILLDYNLLSAIDQRSLCGETKAIFHIKRLEQKNYNEKLLKESKLLIDIEKEKNIKIIFYKGIFLAADLYRIPEYRRTSDIDIMVSQDDYKILKEALIENGYTKKPELFTEFYLSEVSDEASEFTIDRIHEIFFSQTGVIIEVHPTYSIDLVRDELVLRSIFINAVKKDLLGCKPTMLDLHDTIIQMMVHFSDHFFYDSIQADICIGHGQAEMLLSNILDIALCIDKYKHEICWTALYERIKELDHSSGIWFTVMVFDRIYHGVMCRKFISKFESYKRAYKFLITEDIICYTPLNKLVKTNFDDYMDMVYNTTEGRMFSAYKTSSVPVPTEDKIRFHQINFNEIIKNKDNTEGTGKKSGGEGRIGFTYTKEHFNIHIEMRDDRFLHLDKSKIQMLFYSLFLGSTRRDLYGHYAYRHQLRVAGNGIPFRNIDINADDVGIVSEANGYTVTYFKNVSSEIVPLPYAEFNAIDDRYIFTICLDMGNYNFDLSGNTGASLLFSQNITLVYVREDGVGVTLDSETGIKHSGFDNLRYLDKIKFE